MRFYTPGTAPPVTRPDDSPPGSTSCPVTVKTLMPRSLLPPLPLGCLLSVLALLPPLGPAGAAERPAEPAFALAPKAHVALVGNTLADRMQHDGWLETLPPEPLPQATISDRPQPGLQPATS